ncbi:MAG: hypothetical protein OWU33_12065 [Firmicutes bacterium]|nr:hypothetical protein [Bacillota bacterium]
MGTGERLGRDAPTGAGAGLVYNRTAPAQSREDRRRAAVGRDPVGYRATQAGHKVPDGQIMDWIVAIWEQENP